MLLCPKNENFMTNGLCCSEQKASRTNLTQKGEKIMQPVRQNKAISPQYFPTKTFSTGTS